MGGHDPSATPVLRLSTLVNSYLEAAMANGSHTVYSRLASTVAYLFLVPAEALTASNPCVLGMYACCTIL
jgi:hypothetical protein